MPQGRLPGVTPGLRRTGHKDSIDSWMELNKQGRERATQGKELARHRVGCEGHDQSRAHGSVGWRLEAGGGPQSTTQSALGLGKAPSSALLLAAPQHSKPRRPFTTQKSLLTERLLRRLTAVCPLIGKLLTSPRGILIQLN